VPPLRHRREDILLLANFFLERIASAKNPTPQLDTSAIDRLLEYNWPGNVRELQHVVTAAAALASSNVIRGADLPIQMNSTSATDWDLDELLKLPLTEAKAQLVERFERRAIEQSLERNEGNISAAARELGIHRQSLQQKMAQLGIRVEPS
jgi:DNA-binding NtrC family response regulator